MFLPNEYHKVLKFIRNNPEVLSSSKKFIKFQNQHHYKTGRLNQILDELVDLNLIAISAHYDDGTISYINDAKGDGPYRLTFMGNVYFEDRILKTKHFWIPVIASTLLSIASFFISVLT